MREKRLNVWIQNMCRCCYRGVFRGPWKQRGSLSTLQDGGKKQVGKKLINQPVNQPFPAAGTRMRGAARTEEEETIQGRSSPAAVLKGIWKFPRKGLSGRRVVNATGRQSKDSSSSPWREQGQAAGPVRGYYNSPSQEKRPELKQ